MQYFLREKLCRYGCVCVYICKKSSHKPVTKFIPATPDHQSHSELELVPTKNFHPNSHSSEFKFPISKLITSLSYKWPPIHFTNRASLPTFMERKALSKGPYRVIWESGESSSSTWSLSGGSSEGSRGRRVEAVGDEITLSVAFCDGLSTDNIVSSISDTWEQSKSRKHILITT